jgi:hypothetical protein
MPFLKSPLVAVDRRDTMAVDSPTRLGLTRNATLAFPRALPAVRTAPAALALIVTASTIIRTTAAMAHPVPTLFPDEYIYTALARSFGSSGLPLIRGSLAHFPALLAPLLAAPIWALAPTAIAYHLVQAENALFMSLAAIPVYLLARELRLGTRYSLVCALFIVAAPSLTFSARTLADPLGFPLALTAFYAAFVALMRPSTRTQLAFFGLASLASFARVQYVVLFAVYLAALVVTQRRGALRTHRVSLGVVVAGLLAAVAVGPSRMLGYYSVVLHLHVSLGTLHWIGTDLFLIAIGSGIAMVPGALVGLAGARTRAEVTFAALAAFLTAALLFEAGLYASNGADRFQGRYLLGLAPIIPIAFGLYLRNGRRARVPVMLISTLLFILVARLPLSGFAVGTGSTDSPFLWAIDRLSAIMGTGSSSLLVAVFCGCAALVAVLVANGLRARIALVGCLFFLVLGSVAATAEDISRSHLAQREYVSPQPTWIDDAHVGDVTAVATALSPPGLLVEQLFWNQSITREVVMSNAAPTDVFASAPVYVGHGGALETPSGPIRTAVLWNQHGATAEFQGGRLVASTDSFALWKPSGVARLSLLETGRYRDGLLAGSGYLALWPRPGGRLRGRVSFTVTLPRMFKPAKLTIDSRTVSLRPAESKRFSFCIDTSHEWKVAYHGSVTFLPDFRQVSVRQTVPRLTRDAACGS